MSLTQEVKEQAYRLGFTLVGVTTPDPLPHQQVFEAWLAQGGQGEMGYLATPRSRACRAHPQLILPGCRSVLVLGIAYHPSTLLGSMAATGSLPHGRIASYAWGEDYHKLLPRRLRSLVAFIESRVGYAVLNRWYTDTGPLLERELAQRAGLGWIGKNTCLISPHMGSFFLLAEILLGIELDPDPPLAVDRCGTCQRCIKACPTACILPDRTLDARRCISYLTIELKGSIPLGLRPLVGSWIFGCDACQSVCPWNHFATRAIDPAFQPRLASPDPNLLDELSLRAADFNQKYHASPIRRAKHAGYLRNVAVALGNSRHQTAVPGLIGLLQEAESMVRSHAAWALGQVGGSQAAQALAGALLTETDATVKSEIQAALSVLE